jgi:hypothetical protein
MANAPGDRPEQRPEVVVPDERADGERPQQDAGAPEAVEDPGPGVAGVVHGEGQHRQDSGGSIRRNVATGLPWPSLFVSRERG